MKAEELENICYDVMNSLIGIIENNRMLREENKRLREELEHTRKNFEEGFEAHQKGMEQLMDGFLSGKITLNPET